MKDLKIFVVDDDVYYLHLFEKHLHNMSCDKVKTFENGTACLNSLNEKPDVVFLDYNMEELSGYDVLKKIKRVDPNIYVVMVSAQENIKPAVDALKHGAFDYLQKGDDEVRRIKQVLQKVIEVKELLNQNKPGFIRRLFPFL